MNIVALPVDENPLHVKLTWQQAWVSVSMARSPWTRDYRVLGPRYQAHIPLGPAISVTSKVSDYTSWKLIGPQLDPKYHEQS